MLARPCGITAIVILIVAHLVHSLDVTLDIAAIAQGSDQCSHRLALGLDVGMEAQSPTLTTIDLAIDLIHGLQDILALAGTRGLVGERVALDHQSRIVVELGQLHGFPRQLVMVDVTTPLRHNRGTTVGLAQPPHSDHRVVTCVGTAAHIHDNQILRPDAPAALGQVPYLKLPVSHLDQPDVTLSLPALMSVGSDVTHQHRFHNTAQLQLVELFLNKGIIATHAEGFARIAGILGHHQLMAAVFTPLAVVPVDLLQRAAVVPERSLILVHLHPQRRGIIHLQPVDVNLVPRHEHRLLVTASLLCPQPLVMEVVPHAIGGGLDHNHRLGLQRDAATHTAHHIIGVVHGTRLPVGHLAQVGHRDVIAAHRILAAGTAGEHQAVALLELLDVGLSLKFSEPHIVLAIIQQFVRIMTQQQVVHALDAFAGGMQVPADEAVPPLVPHQLHPRHVHLHQRRAAPLARLQQDDAHWAARNALRLHHCQQPPLRPVEHKPHIAAAHLILDGDTAGAPELKVLPDAEPFTLKRSQRQVIGMALQQDAWHMAPCRQRPIPPTAHTCQRIIAVAGEHSLAPLILG